MLTPQYVYQARLRRVVDGDTVVLDIDLGCRVTTVRAIRLLGVNTPEVYGITKVAGLASKAYTTAWLAGQTAEWPLVIETQLDHDDKYGRLLGTIYRTSDGACLNKDLLTEGYAVAYM